MCSAQPGTQEAINIHLLILLFCYIFSPTPWDFLPSWCHYHADTQGLLIPFNDLAPVQTKTLPYFPLIPSEIGGDFKKKTLMLFFAFCKEKEYKRQITKVHN